RSFPRRRRRQQRALVGAPAAAAQRRPAAVDEERGAGRQDGDGGARGGRRGGGGQHVPHRRRRGRRARRHRLPHLLLPQGHVPRVRRRRVRAQVRVDAAGERGQEGPGADRLRKLQRPRQARADRQVARSINVHTYVHRSAVPSIDRFFVFLLSSSPVSCSSVGRRNPTGTDPYREDRGPVEFPGPELRILLHCDFCSFF
uniref:Uncharacterized protein n=1 Tax=Triticum urartu TaxID=4572 RepID=A0A8R7JVV9_TRIUA